MKKNKNVISSLNKMIDIYEASEILKDDGSIDISYRFLSTIFAEIKPLNKFIENIIAMQLIDKESYIVNIRYQQNIKNKMQVKYNDDFFTIKRIIDNGSMLQLIIVKNT